MPLEPEDIEGLRRSLKATRERLDANAEATEQLTGVSEELAKQLSQFNRNIEDFLTLLEQLIPLAEGAAAGNKALGIVLPLVKGIFKRRKGGAGN